MGLNALVLPASCLSFLLDRLLQYENVDEDSSGERGREKLVEGGVPAPELASPALRSGRGPLTQLRVVLKPRCLRSASATRSRKYLSNF